MNGTAHVPFVLTVYFIMLKNVQTYFKNLVMYIFDRK